MKRGLYTSHGNDRMRPRIIQMPSRNKPIVRGLEFTVEPDFRFRRWTYFPFYFENHNASFRVKVVRVRPEPENDPWPNDQIRIEHHFPDGSNATVPYGVPTLEVGDKTVLLIESVYVPSPGQVHFRIPINQVAGRAIWQPLYAYHVRTEESLWVAILSLLLTAAIVGGSIIGAYIERGGQPTITTVPNIVVNPPPIQVVLPTPPSTSGTVEPQP